MKEIVRAFILSKAREVFQEHGFAGATMEEIASASRVSKPTLYNYFKGKQAIFMAVLDDLHEQIAECIKPYIGKTDTPISQRLRGMSMDIAKYFNRHKGLMRIVSAERRLIMDNMNGEGISADAIHRRYFRGCIFESMKDFFRRAQLEGECNPFIDSETLAVMYIGMMGQINLQQVMGEWSKERFKSSVADGISIFCTGIEIWDETAGDKDIGLRGGVK